jgi:MerR family transcriptional regulator/heat shock protein HspR
METPLFSITAAAELAGMHPQTLRQYDRLGLVSPTRTGGRTRRYSMKDVVQLREVSRLSAEGLNLEGIKRIVELESQVDTLTKRVRGLEGALADEMLARSGRRIFAAGAQGDVTPLRAGERAKRATQMVVWSPLRGTVVPAPTKSLGEG